MTSQDHWPELVPLETWLPTYETVHRWTQIVGKIRLAVSPWINHSWHVPLYVTPRGVSTSTMYQEDRAFSIDFDFVEHRLDLSPSWAARRSFDLAPMAVADFYGRMMGLLEEVGIDVHIWPMPVEIPDPIQPFHEDRVHASYDAVAIERFWQALSQANRVMTDFRSRFLGKVSPVHFFWGAFDLAVTRFSGRRAPTHPGGAPHCADWVMQEAYSHEVSSAGFWPGAGFGQAAFYSYAYPEPPGFRECHVRPKEARYVQELGEFILPYESVRAADNPDLILLDFLQSTYAAAADLGEWDRQALESKAKKIRSR